MAILERELEDTQSLNLNELDSVGHIALERLNSSGYSSEEWKAMHALVNAGLMKEIKPRNSGSSMTFKPVTIQGKPLSETIVEERR